MGIHDNFFALGGHSLLATRVSTDWIGACRWTCRFGRLFEAATIAELSTEILTALRQRRDRAPRAGLNAGSIEGSCRCPSAQQRLWFLEQLEPGAPSTTCRARCACEGLSTGQLAAGLKEIVGATRRCARPSRTSTGSRCR